MYKKGYVVCRYADLDTRARTTPESHFLATIAKQHCTFY